MDMTKRKILVLISDMTYIFEKKLLLFITQAKLRTEGEGRERIELLQHCNNNNHPTRHWHAVANLHAAPGNMVCSVYSTPRQIRLWARLCLFSSVHCKDLLGQKLAGVTANQPLEFPKILSQNLSHKLQGYTVDQVYVWRELSFSIVASTRWLDVRW